MTTSENNFSNLQYQKKNMFKKKILNTRQKLKMHKRSWNSGFYRKNVIQAKKRCKTSYC